MAIAKLMNTVQSEGNMVKGQAVRQTGKYSYIDTKHEGIKEVVGGLGGFLVFLDYGRKQKINKKTGKLEYKQDKSLKRVDTLKEAKALRREAEEIRLGTVAKAPSKVYFDRMIEDYKQSAEWKDSTQSAKDHHENYFRHMCDYFVNIQPKDITKLGIENYFLWQLERGKRPTAKKNKDGSVSKKEGISVNTLGKHKCALKKLWQFMVDSKRYGVTENIVPSARLPKVEVCIDGKKKKTSKIEYHPRSVDNVQTKLHNTAGLLELIRLGMERLNKQDDTYEISSVIILKEYLSAINDKEIAKIQTMLTEMKAQF